MAGLNRRPPSFRGNREALEWYERTPKWKIAEIARSLAEINVGDEGAARSGGDFARLLDEDRILAENGFYK